MPLLRRRLAFEIGASIASASFAVAGSGAAGAGAAGSAMATGAGVSDEGFHMVKKIKGVTYRYLPLLSVTYR